MREGISVAVRLESADGNTVLHTASLVAEEAFLPVVGVNRLSLSIPGGLLNSGRYRLSVGADVPNVEILFVVEEVLSWEVLCRGRAFGHYAPGTWKGYINPERVDWRFDNERVDEENLRQYRA